MNEIVVERAGKSYVLIDSSKFNKTSFIRYASLEEIDTILTDADISAETLEAYKEAGAHIEVVRQKSMI